MCKNFVVISVFGVVESHISDPTSSHISICGLDGEDGNRDVQQYIVGESDVITCKSCIKIWRECIKIKKSQIKLN